jgi:hypothetical protein
MSRRVLVRVVDASGRALETCQNTAVACVQSDTLIDIFGQLGLEDHEPISCLLLPHALAPVAEETAWADLHSTLEQVDQDFLELGLQWANVFQFTVGAAIRSHRSTAVDNQQGDRPNVVKKVSTSQQGLCCRAA